MSYFCRRNCLKPSRRKTKNIDLWEDYFAQANRSSHLINRKKKKFRCDICNKKLSTKSNLRIHMSFHINRKKRGRLSKRDTKICVATPSNRDRIVLNKVLTVRDVV